MAFTDEHPVAVGSTITNGSSALRLTSHEERDASWQTSGWRGINIPLEAFGGNPGTSAFVPDYLLGSWRHVPFEWAPVVGGGLEERYVWAPGYRRLQREVRTTEPQIGDKVRVKCTGEEGVVTRSGCGKDGLGLYVETDCNIYRNWSHDAFERVS